jgi:hypothetical protein
MNKLFSRPMSLLPLAVLGASLILTSTSESMAATTKAKSSSKTASSIAKSSTTSAGATGAKGVTQVKVSSDTDHYYVLYAKPVAESTWEIPVAIAKGVSGTTILSDGRKQLATAKYRVETFSNTKPGDVDGDGIDDLTELKGAPTLNALSAVTKLDFNDGVAIVPDRATFEKLSYQGNDVARDSYLSGLEYVKFYITKSDTARPLVYVMNTETWRAHPMFAQAVGISSGRGRGAVGEMRGDVTYYPKAIGPDGTPGLYRFAFQPNDSYSFAEISVAFEGIATQMPFLASKLAYFPIQAGLPYYEKEKQLYSGSRVPVVLEAQLVN